jgi:hypothetical protein
LKENAVHFHARKLLASEYLQAFLRFATYHLNVSSSNEEYSLRKGSVALLPVLEQKGGKFLSATPEQKKMKIFTNSHTFQHPFPCVATAYWLKYPHPLYPHMEEVDVFDRYIDKQTGELVTKRVVSASSPAPSWMRYLPIPEHLVVVEEIRVNLKDQSLTLRTRNLTGSQVLVVQELCKYQRHRENPNW